MTNEEKIVSVLYGLIESEHINSFWKEYHKEKPIKSINELISFTFALEKQLEDHGRIDPKYKLHITLLNEQIELFKSKKAHLKLYSVDANKILKEDWIDEFNREFSQAKSGDRFIGEINDDRYKTKKTRFIVNGVDGTKLSLLYPRYSKYNHPYFHYVVSNLLINSRSFIKALPILEEGINCIASYPNYYWNSSYGVGGSVGLISDILFLLNNQFDKINSDPEKEKLLKQLFMYVSRYIAINPSGLSSYYFYTIRADLVLQYREEFTEYFGLNANMDIQHLSDMKMAHNEGLRAGLPMITVPLKEYFFESTKMYEHAYHKPNDTGGYKEIEVGTFNELVIRGLNRSIQLSEKFVTEFEDGQLNLTKSEVEKLIDYLYATKKDDFQSSFKGLKKFKSKN